MHSWTKGPQLRTMGQEKIVNSNIVSGLEVAALKGDTFLEAPNTYTQESMSVHRGNIPVERDIKRLSYLKRIHLPQIDTGIELLIGTNVPKALEPLEGVWSSVGVELCVISITMERNPMSADDTANGEHVNVEKDGPKD